jgi:hypothetical protein
MVHVLHQVAAEPTITLMKSRRRIAFPEAQTARQQSGAAHVRFGSTADMPP